MAKFIKENELIKGIKSRKVLNLVHHLASYSIDIRAKRKFFKTSNYAIHKKCHNNIIVCNEISHSILQNSRKNFNCSQKLEITQEVQFKFSP
jgi:hypothetical protein